MSDPSAFSARTYDLGPDLALRPLALIEAAAIGAMAARMDPWARYPITAEHLTVFFAGIEPGAPRFGIQVAGTLEGAIAVRAEWFAGPYIQTFALSPRCQGRGVGSRVLAFIEVEARRTHQRNLWVAASDFNTDAHRFYERHGFTRAATVPALLRDDRDEILFRKRLFG
jgi:GNAT superfamily N-acetyltransferase